ncbi:MAG: L-seryl-tRNA(Sec) selenium transferase [Deltaproteobacteria bacterium]|nr:L-seryl-tRNA(Sec) selenium transferase [Deltaproteobacteria bacterium]
MKNKSSQNKLLRDLPAVGAVLTWPEIERAAQRHGRGTMSRAARAVVEAMRERVRRGETVDLSRAAVTGAILDEADRAAAPRLRRVVNATGILVHTNLGRAPLAADAVEAVAAVARGYSNLEYDLGAGARGSRHDHVDALLAEITGAEAAFAVNNNAAAVLLALNALADGREAIVSRGELVEIGGSFRIPEIMQKSGARLVEIGTTNKTRLADYRAAVTDATALILKVHKSNFAMEGFVEETDAADLAALGGELGLPVVWDLGSGSLTPDAREPSVQDAVKTGCALVTFSGDKMLGGPQAGVIAGERRWVDLCRKNPLARALRVDKMTIAALEATLRLYRDPRVAEEAVPILRMAARPPGAVKKHAQALKRRLTRVCGPRVDFRVEAAKARVGGGALPGRDIDSYAVRVAPRDFSAGELERRLRAADPPVIARVAEDAVWLDVRTLLDGDDALIQNALATIFRGERENDAHL